MCSAFWEIGEQERSLVIAKMPPTMLVSLRSAMAVDVPCFILVKDI
jgi:hypothetical protein